MAPSWMAGTRCRKDFQRVYKEEKYNLKKYMGVQIKTRIKIQPMWVAINFYIHIASMPRAIGPAFRWTYRHLLIKPNEFTSEAIGT